MSFPTRQKRWKRWFTLARLLEDTITNESARAIVLTLRHTALRVSDVAVMRRDRVSLSEKGWRIFLRTTKNNAPVFLPVTGVMVQALDAVPPPRKSGKMCPYFFWNGSFTPKSQISEVSETLAAVFRESGVIEAGAHRFRHTLATELLGAGR
jgi:integrase